MATSVVEPARSIGASFSNQNLEHLQAEELTQLTTAEKAWTESYSKSSATPDNYLLSNTLNANKFDFSCNQQTQLSDKEVGKKKSYLDTTLTDTNSRSGAKSFESNFDSSSFNMNSSLDTTSQSYFESQFPNDYDSTKRPQAPMAEKKSERKWDYSGDKFSLSKDRPSSRNIFDTGKSKIDHLAGIDVKRQDFESNFKSFDFELMKKTYNFDPGNQPLKPDQTDKTKMGLQSKKYSSFEDSEFALKLRSSLHSDFLTNELRNDKQSKTEVKIPESSAVLRSVEDILKQYGITDNSPVKPGQSMEDTGKGFTGTPQVGLSSYSRNNEISSGLTIGSSTSGLPALNSQDKDGTGLFPTSGNINALFRTDSTSSSSNLDSKNSTTSNSTFTVNCSQNNETTATSQNNPENEPLRKSGSSVDYSGRMGLYGSSSYRSFDYGKATSFAGENSRSSKNAFSGLDGRQYEGNIDRIKFEGSQVDVGGSGFNINKSTPFDIIKNMGSLTDALEYSMSSERQRLRKLDTMISATPFNYSSIEVSRALKPQYLSPERSYSTLRTNPLTGRGMYSTSNLPSSSGQGGGMSSRNPMVRSTGHTGGTHAAINKSISAPGTGERNLKTNTRHESSVDPSVPYSPYSSRGYNFQYNNAYNPQLLDKISGQKNSNKPQKKALPSKKRECCSKNKKEECGYGHNSQSSYSQNTSGIDFLNTFRGDKVNPADRKRYPVKPESKKPICSKSSGGDVNHSKHLGNMYDGFDFVKDLNRMWKDTVFGTGLPDKSNQKQPKYKPYKPVGSLSNEKKENSKEGRKAREIGGKDPVQSRGKKGDNCWAVTSSAGKHHDYESDFDFNPAHRIRSQSSLEPFRSAQPKNRPSTCSLAKHKSTASSATTKKHVVAAPKSILKQTSSKASCGTSTEMDRPHSAMVLPSQSYTQPLYQTSYHLIRGFSPTDFAKNCRASSISTATRKQESTTKHKPTTKTSKNVPRK